MSKALEQFNKTIKDLDGSESTYRHELVEYSTHLAIKIWLCRDGEKFKYPTRVHTGQKTYITKIWKQLKNSKY